MVDKKSRRKIRDHAVIQQLYEKDPNGNIKMDKGKPVFSSGAVEFMKENKIDAVPKLDKT